MTSRWRRLLAPPEHRVVALLTVAFVCLGTAFALLLPMFSNFDEASHLDRARWTALHPTLDEGPDLRLTSGVSNANLQVDAALGDPPPDPAAFRGGYRPFAAYPGGDDPLPSPCPGLCQNIQYVHPPAWYLLTAPVTAVVAGRPFPWTVLALRLADVVLVAPVVALAWATAREVWPGHPRRRLAVTALVGLFGPLAYTAANANNDALLLPAAAAATWLAARLLRRGADPRWAAAAGAVVTLGLLTKVQMVLVAPGIGLAVLAAPARARERLRSAVAFGAAALPGALWWAVSLLGSSPLSPEGSELLGPPRPGPWSDAHLLTYGLGKVPTLLTRFWGTYDTPVTYAPWPVRTVLSLGVVALVVAWVLARPWRRPSVEQLRWAVLAVVPLTLLTGVLQASVSAYRRDGSLRALAPRYLYPSLALLAIGVVGAAVVVAVRLGRRPGRWTLPALVGLAAAGGAASVVRAAHAAYGTDAWGDLLHVARAVAPLGRPAPLLAVVALAFVATVVEAARAAATVVPARGVAEASH